MIRKATLNDLAVIVRMAEKFYATTSYANWANFSPDTVFDLSAGLIQDHVMLVADVDGEVVGMVGLVVAPFMFNANEKCAHEVCWWVNPDAQGSGIGKELLAAVEPACREAGAGAIQMALMANSPPQAQALYERYGYKHSETSFTKEL